METPTAAAGRGAAPLRRNLTLVLCCLTFAGCVKGPRESMAKLWEKTVAGRAGTRGVIPAPDQAEPVVTANSAGDVGEGDVEGGDDSETVAGTSAGKSTVKKVEIAAKDPPDLAWAQPSVTASPSTHEPENESEPWTPVAAEEETSQLVRLKAELRQDHQRPPSDRLFYDVQQIRLRVESLITQARDHLAVGQLDAAQRLARMAHEISETAGLEFSPQEERPIDLVRRTEDLLRLQGLDPHALPENPAVDNEVTESKPGVAADGPTLPIISPRPQAAPGGDVGIEIPGATVPGGEDPPGVVSLGGSREPVVIPSGTVRANGAVTVTIPESAEAAAGPDDETNPSHLQLTSASIPEKTIPSPADEIVWAGPSIPASLGGPELPGVGHSAPEKREISDKWAEPDVAPPPPTEEPAPTHGGDRLLADGIFEDLLQPEAPAAAPKSSSRPWWLLSSVGLCLGVGGWYWRRRSALLAKRTEKVAEVETEGAAD